MAVQDWGCEACNVKFEVLELPNERYNMDHPEGLFECPLCGAEPTVRLVTAGHGVGLGDEAGYGKHFPYFDRGLGRRIHSRQHREKVCRELGVRPTESGEALRQEINKSLSAREKDRNARTERMAEARREFTEDPELMRLGERGYFDDIVNVPAKKGLRTLR